jgi:hypothetical protein
VAACESLETNTAGKIPAVIRDAFSGTQRARRFPCLNTPRPAKPEPRRKSVVGSGTRASESETALTVRPTERGVPVPADVGKRSRVTNGFGGMVVPGLNSG